MRSPVDRGGNRRSSRSKWFAVAPIVIGLLLATPALPADAATVRAPVTSAVSTSSDSWVMLPMGELSVQDNTFWQLLHTVPGSSQWSVVTPEGVADNGGLVAGTAGGSIVIGFLPSQQLHYSPLAQSIDGGATWSPQLLPAALAPIPDALSYAARAGGALAVIAGDRVLSAPPGLSRWSLLVTASRLARNFAGCGVTTIDAVAILPTGSPLVATGCRGNGVVGVFAKTGGAWRPYGTLPRACPTRPPTCSDWRSPARRWRRSRRRTREGSEHLLPCGATEARRGRRRRRSFCPPGRPCWPAPSERTVPWPCSSAPTVPTVTAYSVEPGGAWARLAQPPVGTTAIALPSGPATTTA